MFNFTLDRVAGELRKSGFVCMFCCLLFACSPVNSSQTLQKQEAKEDVNDSISQPTNNSEQNAKVAFTQNSDSNSKQDAIKEIKSPYQTRPRRRTINFADDCFRPVVAGSKNWKLILACANAVEAVKPEIVKAAKDGNCDDSFENLPDNTSYEVVDGNEILSYTVNREDSKKLDVIAKKLETTTRSLFKNSGLPESDPYQLQTGQILKYQKAHYNYEYGIRFLPFSNNKYLVEMRCWTAAYNLDNIYLLYDESSLPAKARVLEFDWVQPDAHIFDDFDYTDPPSDNYIAKYIKIVKEKTLCGFYFNSKTKTLIAYSKGNGMGKFGQYARYSLKKNGQPILEEFRARFYDDVHNQNYPNYDYEDVIKRPPRTWKRYYPK